jgi:amidase
MSASIYESQWLPKVNAYRAALEKQVEPYQELVKDIDTSGETFNSVEAQLSLLTEEEIKITNLTAKELIKLQKSGELTAVEIYKAFSKRGALAHIFTNCAMQLFFDEGLARAAELDKYREEHNDLVGPLHGIPITLKELMNYGGKVTTAGYVAYLDKVTSKSPREESVSIQILRKLGAVFYIRDSQPQTVMHLDTQSFNGRTINPYNRRISPGGSSGGTSAAIALRSGVMGIGSDIGGSIRVPAAFCGLYGIRATTRRVSGLGSTSGGAGQESILSSQGPLTNSIDDLEYYMESYINVGKPWLYDPNVIPLEWKKAELPEELTFGFILTDTLVKPSAAILRGLDFVKGKLKSFTGKKITIKIINLDNPIMKEAYKQTLQIYGTSKPVHEKLLGISGEPLKPLTEFFLSFANPEENDILTNNNVKEATKFYFNNLFEDEGLDFLISPTSPNVADIPKNLTHWDYSSMFNLIDFPNVIFKTGLTFDPKIDTEGPSNIPDFNPEDYVNAPIGLQLTGRRFQDEKVVEGVKLLDSVLGLQ